MNLPGFEIVRRVGRGGMGEVFHAVRVAAGGFRKPVALKRLALDASIDAKAVQRFLAEARISARLDHPNIVLVHDLLVVEQGHYIVMELLRGRNLVDLVRALREDGPVPWWIPLAAADQILAGLEYAHALADDAGSSLGLVHRDLTPRNIFVCESGVTKILDFGIAKLRHALTPGLTREGALQGTLEFLSPEQARGLADLDPRSDLYQVGATLYWALSGEYPHGAGSPAEIVARALAGWARPLGELRPDLPPAVVKLVEQAMSTEREARPPSAAALRAAVREALAGAGAATDAAALAAVIGKLPPPAEEDPGGSLPPAPRVAFDATVPAADSARNSLAAPAAPVSPAPTVERVGAPARRVNPVRIAVAVAVVAAAGAGGYLAGRDTPSETEVARPSIVSAPPPAYRRLTFRRGAIYSARFTAEGTSYVYSAAWGGEEARPYLGLPTTPEARALDVEGAELLSISPKGEMALLVDVTAYGYTRRGVLARGVSVAGGAKRELQEEVQWAEWHPTRGDLAVVYRAGDAWRLEYPMGSGKILYQTSGGWIGQPRFSPSGEHIAFLDHPLISDDKGSVAIVDLEGNKRTLTVQWAGAQGLAWGPGEEIWFTASEAGHGRALRAVDRAGNTRLLARAPVALTLLDVSPAGKALVTTEAQELRTAAAGPMLPLETDVSLFHFSFVGSMSPDGKSVTMIDGGSDSGGKTYTVYHRPLDGGAAVRIAEGATGMRSPDGKWLLVANELRTTARLVPVGAGQPRTLATGGTAQVFLGAWFPDGQRLLLSLVDAAGEHFHIYDLATDTLAPLPFEGLTYAEGEVLSPDGKTVVLFDSKAETMVLAPIDGSPRRPLPGVRRGERYAHWSRDGRSIYVASYREPPIAIDQIDLAGGERRSWKQLSPGDAAGVRAVAALAMAPEADAYAYTYFASLSTLYLVDGLQ